MNYKILAFIKYGWFQISRYCKCNAQLYFNSDYCQEVSKLKGKVSGFDIEVKSTGHLIELIKKREEKRFVRESALICANKNEEGDDFLDRNKNLSRKGFRRGRGTKTHLPDRIMFNVHPQRWHDRPWPWVKELVGQRVKNLVKAVVVKRRRVGSANLR